MLDVDLAQLYGVTAGRLNEAVTRNRDRFPSDFMFQLTKAEFENLKSQIVTSSWGGLRRATPYAFTEQGVAMLSRANKLAELEHKVASHDGHIRSLFEAIRQLMSAPSSSERRIGFEVKPGNPGKLRGRLR